MCGQTVIKPLIFIENVFGIHRNYALLSKRLKYLVNIRILIEIVVLVVGFLRYVQLIIEIAAVPNNLTVCVIFTYCVTSATIYSLTAIIASYCYSSHYKTLVFCIDTIQKLCENDMLFKARTAMETRRFYIDLTLISAVVIAWISVALHDSWRELVEDVIHFLTFIMGRVLECRYYVESIVFYELSEVVVARLKYLNESILAAVEDLGAADGTAGEELEKVRKEMEKWGEVSHLLAVTCERLRGCLGAQISMAFYWISILYIVLLYSVINYFINQKLLWNTSGWSFVLTMALYLTVKLMILVSGQRSQQEADSLDTNLAKLRGALLAIPGPEAESCARAARSLRRRVRSAPARVRLHDALPLSMSLLVDILAAVVSYAIVLLQFNHVV